MTSRASLNSSVKTALLLTVLFLLMVPVSLAEGRIDRVEYDHSRAYVGDTVPFTIYTSGAGSDCQFNISIMKDGTDFMGFFFSSSPDFSYTFPEAGNYSLTFQLDDPDGGGTPVSCALEVVQGVQSMTLERDTFELETGDMAVILPTLAPDNAYDKTILYTPSNPGIATVDEYGVITAVSAGTCSIRVTARGSRNTWQDVYVTVTQKPFGFTGVSADYHFAPPDDPDGPVYGEIGQSADFSLEYELAGQTSASTRMNVYFNDEPYFATGWTQSRRSYSYTFSQPGSYAIEFEVKNPAGDAHDTHRLTDDIVIRPAPERIVLPFEEWTLSYNEIAFLPTVTIEPAGANQHVNWTVSSGSAAYISSSLEDDVLVARAEGRCVLTCQSEQNPALRASISVIVGPLQEIRANEDPLGETLQVGVPFEFNAYVDGPSVAGASYTIELRSEDLDLIASGQTLSWTFEGPGTYVIQLRVRKKDGSVNVVSHNITIVGPEIHYAVDELVLATGRGVNSIYLASGFMRWDAYYGLQYENLSWSAMDTSVVSIDSNGYIRGRKPGSTTVVLDYYGFQYLLNVRVVRDMDILMVPEGTTEILQDAFKGTAADIVALPSGIKRIESGAFSDMDSLKYVIVEQGDIDCDIAADAFDAGRHILASYFGEDEWDDWDQYIDDHFPDWSFMGAASWNLG